MELSEQAEHHKRQKLCRTRKLYRRPARRVTAVRSYCFIQESNNLLVTIVPSLNLLDELAMKFSEFGSLKSYRYLNEYPCDDHCDAVLISFNENRCARLAKKHMDDYEFYGNVLHVCYCPELETIDQLEDKLQERIRIVGSKRKWADEFWADPANRHLNVKSIATHGSTKPNNSESRRRVSNEHSAESGSCDDILVIAQFEGDAVTVTDLTEFVQNPGVHTYSEEPEPARMIGPQTPASYLTSFDRSTSVIQKKMDSVLAFHPRVLSCKKKRKP